MPGVSFQRFDLGWTDAQGGHDLIFAWDGSLSGDQLLTLLEWSDSTRDDFEQHWYWIALDDSKIALARVSPQFGGLRGRASTTQAVVIGRLDLAWAADPSPLIALFPDPPERIGAKANWSECREVSINQLNVKLVVSGYGKSLGALVPQLFGACEWRIPLFSQGLPMIEELTIGMRLFSLCPPNAPLKLTPRYSSRNAPANHKQAFRFALETSDTPPLGDAALVWLLDATRTGAKSSSSLNFGGSDSALGRLIEAILFSNAGETRVCGEQVRLLLSLLSLIDQSRESLRGVLLAKFEEKIDSLTDKSRCELVIAILARKSEFVSLGVPALWPLRLLSHPEVLLHINEQFLMPFSGQLLDFFPSLVAQTVSESTISRMPWLPRSLTTKLNGTGESSSSLTTQFHELVRKVLASLVRSPMQLQTQALMTMCWELITICVYPKVPGFEPRRPLPINPLRSAAMDAYHDILFHEERSGRMLAYLAVHPAQFAVYLVGAIEASGGDKSLAVHQVIRSLSEARRIGAFNTLREQLENGFELKEMTDSNRTIVALITRVR